MDLLNKQLLFFPKVIVSTHKGGDIPFTIQLLFSFQFGDLDIYCGFLC